MDWNLPLIYDEYIEDGFLILCDQHIKNNKIVSVTNGVKIDHCWERYVSSIHCQLVISNVVSIF